MNKALVKVGRLGKAHGLKGEIKVKIEDAFFDDLVSSDSLLIEISGQYIPYFVDAWRSDGALLKLEEVDDKEAAFLLQQKDIYLPEDKISEPDTPTDEGTPFDHWINWTIQDSEIGKVGQIDDVVDLPQHYLAEVNINGNTVMIPLHEDLIESVDEKAKLITMNLPEGLLEL